MRCGEHRGAVGLEEQRGRYGVRGVEQGGRPGMNKWGARE